MSRDDEAEKPQNVEETAPTLDSDEASRALARVQQILERDEDRVRERPKAKRRSEVKEADEDKNEDAGEARHISPEAAQELRDVLEPLHPADIAWVLEALPLDDRLAVWNQVQSESDGDILLEVNEGVRRSEERRVGKECRL